MPTVCHDTLVQPATLREALELLAEAPTGRIRPLAGGTDLFANRAIGRQLLDLSRLTSLANNYLVHGEYAYLRLGAALTWQQCREGKVEVLAGAAQGMQALRMAAGEIGGPQIQARGTLVGNLCNGSPAADGIPVLLSLAAQVECVSLNSARIVPLADFLLGPRKTLLAPDELVVALRLPVAPSHWRCASHFQKLGARASLLISIAMVSVWIAVDTTSDGVQIAQARVAVGSCSAVAWRCTALELRLQGLHPSQALALLKCADWNVLLAPLRPIDDVRASAHYRRHAAGVLLARSIQSVLEQFA